MVIILIGAFAGSFLALCLMTFYVFGIPKIARFLAKKAFVRRLFENKR